MFKFDRLNVVEIYIVGFVLFYVLLDKRLNLLDLFF